MPESLKNRPTLDDGDNDEEDRKVALECVKAYWLVYRDKLLARYIDARCAQPLYRPAHKLRRLYYEAFWRLSRSRQVGMNGPQPIAMSDMVAYLAAIDEDDPDMRMTYIDQVQAMDAKFLQHVEQKMGANK